MKTFSKSVVACATGTIGILVLAGSANATPETTVWAAQVSSGVQSRHVSYADLNLESDAGMATLQRRIERAASEVCGSTDIRLAGSLGQVRENAQCREDAVAAALSQVPSSRIASTN